METVTSKVAILESIQDERAKLEETLASIPEDRLTIPVAEIGWSVKDILAHLTAWEQLLLGWVQASERGETPDRPAPGKSWDDLDALNEELHQAHKDRPLAEVLEGFHSSYQQVIELVTGMSEADLLDPQRYAWRRGDPMWHMVAANTWWHYKEHRESIAAWLESSRDQP